jgi:hypothetical protein
MYAKVLLIVVSGDLSNLYKTLTRMEVIILVEGI